MAVCMLNDSVGERDECDRRHGRVRVEETKACLGTVLDLSRSGMRIRTKKAIKPESPPISVALKVDGGFLMLQCRVAWVTKDGMFKRQVGLEFQGVDEEQTRQLADVARTAANNCRMSTTMLNRAV